MLQVYRHIILPILAPITLSAMIVLGHISLKIFDLIFVMAGPDNATTDVPGVLMFVTAFRGNEFAKGAVRAIQQAKTKGKPVIACQASPRSI